MSFYCKIAPGHPVHHHYHAKEYGFPTVNEHVLFERLALEIMQAGLSWEIVLKKRKGLNRAFHNFRVDKVAAYGARDVRRLLKDAGIIRNRLKIAAIIENARRIRQLRKTHKGLAGWIAAHHPRTKKEWVALFREQFLFTGGEIVGEFLMSIGYLPDAHHPQCAIYKAIAKKAPPWMKATRKRFRKE
ncbi:MAG TPA: DNA-3-methyladenine glycosylase I [Alphaproteobacteria bacterium]|nr:DNA-3-methyladenine glycosylase I [Alphaproteobacteria bacterium]